MNKENKASLIALALSCLTKLTGFVAVPGMLYAQARKRKNYFLLAAIPAFFAYVFRSEETAILFLKQAARILSPLSFLIHKPEYALFLPWTFWGMPHFKWARSIGPGIVAWVILAPILWGIIQGFPRLKQRNRALYDFLLISSPLFLLACLHTYGDARYMIPIIPLWSVPLALFLEKHELKWSLWFLVLFSTGMAAFTVALYAGGY